MPTPTLQLVTFGLDGLSHADYRHHCEQVAPRFAELAGLRSKVWLGDAEENVYGGVYAWEDRGAMQAYLSGDVFGALRSTPGIHQVTTRAFGVLAEPTAITRG